ncbi:hypothetical protein [Mycolicibacterium sp. P1-5]|uniref:hypothetical protein n=1 Tax=Mycolicibacterium sp. P1-5 TaxID=2024617 RepID=UPI001D13B17B|nr:hypothetical protein [Mycolicibacterium sp. P1-5]
MRLVENTGFDAFDAGVLADSWRQQPGSPAYCTDLTLEEMPAALAAAEKDRLPARRDIAVAAIAERVGDGTWPPPWGSNSIRGGLKLAILMNRHVRRMCWIMASSSLPSDTTG